MADNSHDHELLSTVLDRQFALFSRRAAQHRPHLSHRHALHGDFIHRDEMIAGLHALRSSWDRRFSVEISNSQNLELAAILRLQNKPDHVEVGKVEQPSNVEVDGRVRVIESHTIVEKRL